MLTEKNLGLNFSIRRQETEVLEKLQVTNTKLQSDVK